MSDLRFTVHILVRAILWWVTSIAVYRIVGTDLDIRMLDFFAFTTSFTVVVSASFVYYLATFDRPLEARKKNTAYDEKDVYSVEDSM